MKLKFRLLALTLLSGVSFTSMAATDADVVIKQRAQDEDVVVVRKEQREVYADSSEAMRIGKKVDAHFVITGISANFAPGSAVSVGMFLDRNSLIAFEARKGKGTLSRSSRETYNKYSREFSTDTQVSQFGVHYKKFAGNSFYFRTGMDYSTVDYTYDLTQSDWQYSKFLSKFKGEAFIASFVIGNQWHWENFTLGCDWIGLAAPISHSVSGVKPPPDDSWSYERSEFENDQKRYVSDSSGILLRFYLGATF